MFLCGAVALAAGAAREATLRLEAAPLAGRGGALGYNGASPGPLLRGQAGAPLRLTLLNKLSLPTSMRLPGYAGLTAPALAPGETRDLAFTPEAPGFDLYGPFGPAAAAGELGAGLFGAVLIDEPSPPVVDFDTVVIFSGADPRALRANAGLAPLRLTTPLGSRVRLRLANASPDLLLTLRASDAAAVIVAIDGQPCEPFSPRGGEFPLCPSARFELMFDLDSPFVLAMPNGNAPMLQITPGVGGVARRPPIAALPANPRLPLEIALERAQQVRIVISGAAPSGFSLNGVGGADWPEKPLFKVARGSPVALALVNQTEAPQTLRLEGAVARILHALDDGWDPYWRDALFIGPGQTLHVAFVADRAGKWPLASTSPPKRAMGMAGWYAVT